MTIRYVYNGQKYDSEFLLRQAVLDTQKIVYGYPKTEAEYAEYGIEVKIESYDPMAEMPLDQVKKILLNKLDTEFNAYRQSSKSYITSSLGFKVNCNETAFNSVQGVIMQATMNAATVNKEGKILFTDFDDQARYLSLEELKTLGLEISVNGSRAYSVKWTYREQIENATAYEELHNLTFDFN